MSLMDDLNRAARSVMDFFFPRQCPFCGGIVGRELLCDKCRKTLPYTGEHAVVDGRFGSAAANCVRRSPGWPPPRLRRCCSRKSCRPFR